MREASPSTLWKKLTGTTCLTALLVAGSVAPTFAADEEERGFKGLEEIVITASKREQTLQEAGMSVTAIGAQDLERMGATSFTDFAVRVPNLGFGNESDGRFNANSPAIRGVFGDNTTGFYIDDTPLPASIQPRVIDVQRIEVLRGPQGSLYGARSMGGTIRLITKQPDFDEASGSAHATLSTVKEGTINWSFDSSVNIPVVEDKLAIRATAYIGQNSGVFDRVYQPTWVNAQTGETVQNTAPAFDVNKNVDSETYGGFQLVAKAQIAENLTFTPKLMYQKINADGLPFADINPGNFTRTRFFNTEEPGSDRWWLASGTLNWDLDSGTIVSTTSYFDRFINEREEEHTFLHFLFNQVIGIPLNPLESPLDENERYKSFVHETRYTSDFDGPVQVTAGIYYQRTRNRLRYDPPSMQPGLNDAIDAATFPGLAANCDFGFCLTTPDLIFTTDNKFNTKEYAAFGEVTFDVTEAISITAGGRWSKTETDAVIDSDGFANSGPTHADGTTSDTRFNPKILLQGNVNENFDIYASASKGYRIGGVNGALPENLCSDELDGLAGPGLAAHTAYRNAHRTFDSDSLWSYEAGFKSNLADNRVSLNGAVYFIKWDNIIQQNRLGCGFQVQLNSGQAEIKGFEIEMMAAPIDGLTLTAALGYADAKITKKGDGGVADVGDKIQGVPNWTMSATGEYIFPLTNALDGLLRADFNYYGRSFSTNNGDQRKRPSWNALNLRAGVIRDDWEIALFITNVTNTHANLADSRSIAAETPGRQRLVTNRPRTIGIDVRTHF
ncbi:MAG: TonB-dependent receptor [Alphaproteobacteria bacterium]|nr:MAG: TonB-dependent receptor [Alphaproteobacteria bacterium]